MSNSELFEDKVQKFASLEPANEDESAKYPSILTLWKKKGEEYHPTEVSDSLESLGYYGKHQKLVWVIVIIGAILLFGIYTRYLLYQKLF